MNIEEMWDKARKRTEILRMRMLDLSTFDATRLPYIFLAESSVNPGDTVIRKGSVLIERPAIVMPGFSPQFSGFELEKDLRINEDALATFLLVRGIHFPSPDVRVAVHLADARARKAVAASDAFFPFPDGVERLGEAGVTAVIQPGGSIRDQEVIQAADKMKMAMIFTGMRHFRH